MHRRLAVAGLAVAALQPPAGACAQGITIDGRLSAAQTLAGPNYAIGASLGRQVGPNLFHSFGQFNVRAGESATFSGPATVTNVIGRVTGGAPSTIAGRLSSTIQGAGVTLINPAGIAITPGAVIDVPGAFRASTADEVRFSDGARFSARTPDAGTLTHAPPVAFGFLGPAQPVTITGAQVNAAGIAVAGGAVTISGSTLSAPGGEVRIAATAGAGEVKLARGGPASTVTAWAPVRIENGAAITTTDPATGSAGAVRIRGGAVTVSNARIAAEAGGNGTPGSIKVRGESLTVERGGAVSADGFGLSGAGTLDVTLDGALSIVGNGAGPTTLTADGFAPGPAGTVRVRAASLTLSGRGYLTADGVGDGDAGLVDIRLDGALELLADARSGFAGISASAYGAGAAGRVQLATGGDLVVRALAPFSFAAVLAETSGAGSPGSIAVAAGDTVRVAAEGASSFAAISATTTGAAHAGTVAVQAQSGIALSATGASSFAAVRADSFAGGDAGVVRLVTPAAVSAQADPALDARARLSATAFGNATGAGGSVTIEAGDLHLGAGSEILASNFAFGQGGTGRITINLERDMLMDGGGRQNFVRAYSGYDAGGTPGRIDINARDVVLLGGASIDGSGDGYTDSASITVTARRMLQMGRPTDDSMVMLPSSISTEAWANSLGNAGDITIRAGEMALWGSGLAASTLGFGLAGTVRVEVDGMLIADGLGNGGGIGANTFKASGDGGGGAVLIRAGSMVVSNGMEIQASTTNAGNAGEIRVDVAGELRLEQPRGARYLTLIGTNTNAWDNSPGGGAGGRITVNAGSLVIRDGAQITSSSAASAGNAGAIEVNVAGTLDIAGRSGGLVNALGLAMPDRPSGIVSTSTGGVVNPFPPGTGDAGTIRVAAGAVRLAAGGAIATSTEGPGRAGSVTVATPSLGILAGSEIASSTSGAGPGGNVAVLGGDVTLSGAGARIAASSTGAGRAGNVLVSGGSLAISDGASVTTAATGSGGGGNVDVRLSGALDISGPRAPLPEAGITAQTAGTGRGGTVTIEATSVSIGPRGQVTARSTGAGHAGDIALSTPGALVIDGRGAGSGIEASTGAGGGDAGRAVVRAGSITLADGGQIIVDTAGAGRGGVLDVEAAQRIEIGDRLPFGDFTGIGARTQAGATGRAGDVRVAAPEVRLGRFGEITSDSLGAGAGGAVRIEAGQLWVDNRGAISSLAQGSGAAGTIGITADEVAIAGLGRIGAGTRGSGRGGDIDLSVTGHLSIEGPVLPAALPGALPGALAAIEAVSEPQASGDAGNITIRAGSAGIGRRGAVSTVTNGSGAGGTIRLDVAGGLTIDGGGDIAAVTAGTTGAGAGGAVHVRAGSLALRAGGQVNAVTAGAADAGSVTVTVGGPLAIGGSVVGRPAAAISAQATPGATGNAGSVSVQARSITVGATPGGIGTETFGPGRGGDIRVVAEDAITLDGPSQQLRATSTGTGDAGNITIRVSDIIRMQDAAITASVSGGRGTGGNIDIDPRFVVLDASRITAQAFGGNGGNITLVAQTLVVSPDSLLSASSALGLPGTVTLRAPEPDTAGSLSDLPSDLRAAPAVLRQACAARASLAAGSLVLGTPGGLPHDPGAMLPATYLAGRPLGSAGASLHGQAGLVTRGLSTAGGACG